MNARRFRQAFFWCPDFPHCPEKRLPGLPWNRTKRTKICTIVN